MRVHLWALYTVPLIYVSVFIPVPCCFDLLYDPMISLLGTYPKELKTLIQENTSTPMFIKTLFAIAKIWMQHKCPLVGEWIKQLWDIYTMEYYSDIKRKENLPFATPWMDLENVMLNFSVWERQISHDFIHMWNQMNRLN